MLYGIKDSSNITVISNATKKQVLYANYSNKTDINFSSQAVYALKKGVKAISWDTGREGTMTQSMQVFDLKWIALLFGTDLRNGKSTDKISHREVLNISNATASFKGDFIPGSLTVFPLDTDGITQLDELVSTTTDPTDGEYQLTSSGEGADKVHTLKFNAALKGQVVIYALKPASEKNKKFVVEVNKYPTGYTIYLDTTIKGNDGVEEMVQIAMYNVKPQSNVNLTFDAENVCTLDITWDILADTNNDMLHFTTL